LLCGAALLVLATGCNTRTPLRWEIPAGYVGWTVVQYESATCAAFPLDSGYKVIRLNERGVACTSEKLEAGEAFDRYLYVENTGHTSEIDQGTLVWAGVYFSHTKREFHFIGSEADYHASPDNSQTVDQRCSADPNC